MAWNDPPKFPRCCKCDKELLKNGVEQYGNMCRKSETYCKECWDKVPQKEKDLISWHFSCDWL